MTPPHSIQAPAGPPATVAATLIEEQPPALAGTPAPPAVHDPSQGTTRRRRGRRPAGAGTRDQILTCARRLFHAHGYQRVSLRAIAREADVDPALVHHYFRGKPAIFLATLSDVGIDISRHLGELAQVPREQLGRELVRRGLELWGDAPTDTACPAACAPPVQALREFFAVDVLPRLPITGEDGSPDGLRAEVVASQVLGLLATRRLLSTPHLRACTTQELIDLYGPLVQQTIDGTRS